MSWDRKHMRLWMQVVKMKGKIFYMRYVKIIVLAIAEVIAELMYSYTKNEKK
jgi:hypothetical protein